MSPLIVATALSVLALDSAPATSQTAVVAPAVAAGSQPAKPAPDIRTVCRAEELTGSRFQRRLCLTRAEWIELDRRQQQEMQDWERRTDEHTGYAPTAGTLIGANGATGGQVR